MDGENTLRKIISKIIKETFSMETMNNPTMEMASVQAVFYNGEEYTIVMNDGNVYAVSSNTKNPYKEQVLTLPKIKIEDYVNEARNEPDWLGQEIMIDSLPENIAEFIESAS